MIVSPGAMGSALARGYREAGARVVASVAGRSARTRELAQAAEAAGVELLGSLEEAVAAANIVLSVVPPAAAVGVAETIAAAAVTARVRPLFADLNAIAPATIIAVAAALRRREEGRPEQGRPEQDGLDLVDGSISGPPPTPGPSERPRTRLYLSGPRADEVARLPHAGLGVRVLPGPAGTASAVKMSTASVNKGFSAIFMQAARTAYAAGVLEPVLADLAGAFPAMVAEAPLALALSASKADRYVGEMREIARAQAAAGLGPELFEAMAGLWEQVAATPAGQASPEQAQTARDLTAVLRTLAGGPPATD